MKSKSTLVLFLVLVALISQAVSGTGERTAILSATPEIFKDGKILEITPNRPKANAPAPWGSLGTFIADSWAQDAHHLREAARLSKFPAEELDGFESVIDYIGPAINVNSRFTFEYPESVAVWFRPATQCSLISLLIRFDNYTPPDGSGLLGQTVDIGVYQARDEYNGTFDFTGYDLYFQGEEGTPMLGDKLTSVNYNVSSLPVYGEFGVTDPPIELDLDEFTVDGYVDIGKNDFLVSFIMPEGNDDASDLWAAGPPNEGNVHGFKYYANGRGTGGPGWIARYNFAIAAKVLYYGDPPPTIEDIEDLPDVYASVDPGPYTPTARIFDIGTDEFQGDLDAVWFIYSANGVNDTLDVTGQGVNDVYTGEIPSLPVGTEVEYWWWADDNGEDNPDTSVAETHFTESEHRFFTIREKDPNATILVVNDQAAQPVSSYYLDLLDAFGYGADYWDIDSYGLMTQGVLDLYSTLIWYQGSGTGGVLANGLDTMMVPNYLDNGGNLFLSSSDYIGIVHDSDFSGEWTAASYPFATDYLHIGFYNSDSDADESGVSLDTLYRGVAGDDLGDGIEEFLVVPEDLEYTNWNDMVETDGEGYGFLDNFSPIVEEDWSAETGGVYFDGDFKTVFVPFPFEAIRDEMVRKELMMRILGFFGENARPVFTEVMGSRYGVEGSGPFEVTAYVEDMDGTVESVELGYAINGGDYTWSAMSGSEGMYSGSIPALSAQDTVVEYSVKATDDVGGINYSDVRDFYTTDFVSTVNNLLYVGDNPFDWYTGDNIDPIMTGYLDNLGYDYDVWDADMLYTMDAHTVLNNYHTVVWAGYADWDPGVFPRSTDANPLTEYVEQGGNLFMSSAEIMGAWTDWTDGPFASGESIYDLFGVTAVYNDFGYYWLFPFDSSAVTADIDSFAMDTTTATGLNLANYADYVEPAAPVPFLGDDLAGSVYYTGTRTNNTVFLAFELARLYPEDGEQLLGNVLTYFETPKVTAIGDDGPVDGNVPVAFDLKQNYPNPFNPVTNIEFALANATDVKIAIYNVLGEKVRTLTDQNFKAGSHRLTWNGTNESGSLVSSGVYIYKIETPEYSASRKMILMK